MRSQTRLVPRGSVYYFRARIPADLREHFGNQREIKESLKISGATNKREAERLVLLKSVELDNRFEELRRLRSAAPLGTISDEAISYIVAKATATRMKADKEGRIIGMMEDGFKKAVRVNQLRARDRGETLELPAMPARLHVS